MRLSSGPLVSQAAAADSATRSVSRAPSLDVSSGTPHRPSTPANSCLQHRKDQCVRSARGVHASCVYKLSE